MQRFIEGQRSDRLPIKRSTAEKKAMIAKLREDLKGLKPTAAPAIGESIRRRVAELEAEVKAEESERSRPAPPASSARPPRQARTTAVPNPWKKSDDRP